MNKWMLYLLVGCFMTLAVRAQQTDITGVWHGELMMNDTAGNLVKLPYEVAVSEEKGKLTGYSRIVFHANGKDEAGIQDIQLKWKGKEIVMEDEGFIKHQFSINPSKRVKKTMVVTLRETDQEIIMEGNWSTNATRNYLPAKGTVVLRRRLDFKKSPLFVSLDTLQLLSKLSFKDRPELPPVTAMIPPPSPEFIIPAIPKVNIVREEIRVSTRSIYPRLVPFTAYQKMQMNALRSIAMKPAPKPVPLETTTVAAASAVKKEIPTAPQSKPVPTTSAPSKSTVPPVAAVKPAPPPVAAQPASKPAAVQAATKPVVVQAPPVIPVQQLAAPSVLKGAAEIDKRVTRTDQSFYFQSDSLVLTLYDNGEVDGDTVTVLMNGSVLFSKAGLDIQPNTKTLYITPSMDSVKLVMYAESLGEIPPNTGLLIVNDGDKRYEVRFSADLKTNAGIVLRRKKNEDNGN